jgi:elongation factor P--(R)-beta-lysine ligase
MYDSQAWQPTASIETLKIRAQFLSNIRQFFATERVMEVDTQTLSLASITDPHIEALTLSTSVLGQQTTYYLQTSPEFAMKRLLCAGTGDIYQLGKAFRAEDVGRRHAVEFTMLEWYCVDKDHWQLMQQIEQLLQHLFENVSLRCERLSYQAAFLKHLNLDPHTAPLSSLQEIAYRHTEYGSDETDQDVLLDLLFSHVIEPQLGKHQPCFIHSYPASQAALAKCIQDTSGVTVASRFELYWQGIELANGYHELTDPQEQSRRFKEDLIDRKDAQKALRQVDERLVTAMQQGLPECAGVALGVDRLLMLLCQKQTIAEVIPFANERA